MVFVVGSPFVRCSLCAAITRVPILFYNCRGCGLYLVYSSTFPRVMCSVCLTVYPPLPERPSAPPFSTLSPLNHTGQTRPPPRLPQRMRRTIPLLPSTPAVRAIPGPRPPPMHRVPASTVAPPSLAASSAPKQGHRQTPRRMRWSIKDTSKSDEQQPAKDNSAPDAAQAHSAQKEEGDIT